MILPITYAGHPILYKKCKEIPLKELNSAKIQTFLDDLGETVSKNKKAAGFAAPQVNKSLRVFCLKLNKQSLLYDVITPKTFQIQPDKPFFFINPKIEAVGSDTDIMGEGCLSIPYYFVYVERAKKIKVSAYTREGQYFEIYAYDLYARYIQHEFDHLNGILLFQRAKRPEDIVYQLYETEELLD